MWLTGCLAPDFKTIADFRKDDGPAIRKVCREFIVVCGRAGLLAATTVAIDGSKFKAAAFYPGAVCPNLFLTLTISAGSSIHSSMKPQDPHRYLVTFTPV
jgi:hypothetical protein